MSNRAEQIKNYNKELIKIGIELEKQAKTLTAKEKYARTMRILKQRGGLTLSNLKQHKPINATNYNKKFMDGFTDHSVKKGYCLTNNNDLDMT